MKYLLYLAFYDTFHAHLDKLLYNMFLKDEKSSVVCIYQCRGSLPYCPAIDTPLPKISHANFFQILKKSLLQSILRPAFCTKCINSTNTFFNIGNKYRFAPLGLGLYLKSLALYCSPRRLTEKFHESCSDHTISCYLVSTRMELIDVRPSFKLARFLVTRDFHIQETTSVLNKLAPDVIGIFNGRMLPFRSILNVARDIAKRTTVIIHERGFEDHSFIVKINEPAHSRASLSKIFSLEYENISRSVPYLVAREWARHFFEGRQSGSNLDCIAPKYISNTLERNSIYYTDRKLVVIYLTTPDEVDPCSGEFMLIRHQWDLIPMVCRLLNNSFGVSNIRIVIRTHPNFFLRFNTPLINLKAKIGSLKRNLKLLDNVFIDETPKDTSPYLVYKHSFLSVSLASSSLLESEYFGTPSIVDSGHIYRHGVSYSFDFGSLLNADPNLETSLPSSLISKMNSGASAETSKVIRFSYIWYYMNTFRFETLKYTHFNKLIASNIIDENGTDFNFIKNHLNLNSIDFIMSRISSFRFT